ncbi:hypothetical protein V172_06955 [Citrobacter freundii RLS1]|nr:hypothetical protein V172_06955 [Citrobacter freundii RLS1]VDZ55169.1 Uncharacterised protein [Citrobacter freundii]
MVFPAYIFRLIINSIYYFFCMYHRLVDFILFFLRFFIIYPYAYVSDIVFMNMFMLAKTTIKKILFP